MTREQSAAIARIEAAGGMLLAFVFAGGIVTSIAYLVIWAGWAVLQLSMSMHWQLPLPSNPLAACQSEAK